MALLCIWSHRCAFWRRKSMLARRKYFSYSSEINHDNDVGWLYLYMREIRCWYLFFFSLPFVYVWVGCGLASPIQRTHSTLTMCIMFECFERFQLLVDSMIFFFCWCYSTTIDKLNTSIECEVSEWWMDHFLAVQKNVWANTNLLFAFNSCENYFLMALFNSTAIQSALRMLSHHDRRVFSTCFHQVQKVRHSKWYHGISCA